MILVLAIVGRFQLLIGSSLSNEKRNKAEIQRTSTLWPRVIDM